MGQCISDVKIEEFEAPLYFQVQQVFVTIFLKAFQKNSVENCDDVSKADTNLIDKNNDAICSCSKYNKTMDEVVQAASKHRDAAVTMKEINNELKKKLTWYRNHLMEMQAQIDKLEQDNISENEMIKRLVHEKKILNDKLIDKNDQVAEIRILKEELEEKVEKLEHIKETSDKSSLTTEIYKLKKNPHY